jgi:nicotinate-nucleotide adenylyltransferase
MKRIGFYGGSFDPLHIGHLTIAKSLTEEFELDEFVFIPAFHAPHKRNRVPTSAFSRHAMLCLATNSEPRISVSRIELELPEKPYSIETLTKLKHQLGETHEIFFVIGADSWMEITTWREWENLLKLVNVIVVTRPNYEIGFSHVTEEIRDRIIDLRTDEIEKLETKSTIYITDLVNLDISATAIRLLIADNKSDWEEFVPPEVAKYIKKYELYRKEN